MKKITALLLAAALIAAAACAGVFAVLKPLGDANGDGETDNKDVVTLFRSLSGNDIFCDAEVCDLNEDGSVDNKDVVLLFRLLSSGQDPGFIDTDTEQNVDLEGREVVILINGTPGAANDLKKDRKSGLHEYDLAMLTANEICTLAMEDCLADLNKVPYIDLSDNCWDNGVVSAFTVADRLFCITGDLSAVAMDNTYLLAFNKAMLSENGVETPYNAVRNGDFTLDLVYADAYMMYQDINENYTVDALDEFGFGAGVGSIAPLFFGMGGKLTEFDENGSPSMTFSDRTIGVAQKMSDLFNEGLSLTDADETVAAAFAEGRLAFYPTAAAELCTLIKETENDYGILPLPKASSDQESYYSFVSQDTLLYAVPYNADGYDVSGCVLESLCKASDNIIPVYCGMLAQTEDDAQMLEIVLRSRNWALLYHGLYPELDEEIITAYETDNVELFMFMCQFKAEKLLSDYENKIKSNVH